MPEDYKEILEWWELDYGQDEPIKLSNAEAEALTKADKQGARFFRLDEIILNIAFVRSVKKVVSKRIGLDVIHSPLSEKDKKFLVKGGQNGNKQLSSDNRDSQAKRLS